MKFYVYDLETFPNCFLWSGKFEDSEEVQVFEMSFRKNDKDRLLSWLSYLQSSGAYLIGYNSIGFDYPITHDLLNNIYTFNYEHAHRLCMQIIGAQEYGFTQINYKDRILSQVDLAKINHFDNANKRTSLKSLQFAMRAESVEDLPFEPNTVLTSEQIETLITYNIHDIKETERFLKHNKHLIEMRKELLDQGVLSGDVLNFSDVKIGIEYLIKRIGRQKCFSGHKPRQTFRSDIEFKDLILPKITYRTEPFQQVKDWFEKQKLYIKSEDERPHLETSLAGLDFHFGVGGVHASVESKKYESNSTHIIKDVDVSGMYVAVAIANGFAPEHLGRDFSDAYKQLQSDRAKYKKGTTMNAVLKLAGNGVYGNSNNPYSCFYDPKYTFQVTINGQLQLLQLVEVLSLIPGIEIIQANTDGITCYMPRKMESLFQLWKSEWEKDTNLKLEEVEYSKMWIRDVNNYVAVKTNGEVKLKGAYWYPKEDKEYDGVWNKDFSNMVVQKVIEQVLTRGWKAEEVVKLISDPFDFMMRYKTPAGAKVFIGDKQMPKTVRYYVSTKGEPMRKVATPKGEIGQFKRKNKLTDAFFNKVMSEIGPNKWDERIHTANRKTYEQVVTSIESGRLVKNCNLASNFDWSDVDYDYYLEEIKKLEIK